MIAVKAVQTRQVPALQVGCRSAAHAGHIPWRFVFPPPAAGAEVLAQADGAGAGRAADAGEKLVVQRVVGDVVELDVVPDVAPGPVGQRVDLDAAFGFDSPRPSTALRRGRRIARGAGRSPRPFCRPAHASSGSILRMWQQALRSSMLLYMAPCLLWRRTGRPLRCWA